MRPIVTDEQIAELRAIVANGGGATRAAPAELLRFLTPAELRNLVPPEPPWLLDGYLAVGSLTLLAGKPKVGKSTLSFALTEAIATDAPSFLGRAVRGGPVVYVSEEGSPTLLHKLPRGNVRVLTRDLAWPKPSWKALIAAAVAEAERVGAVLLVVDTLSFWAAPGTDREKDSGAMQAAMDLLLEHTTDVAILLDHHQRKGGGEEGEGIRGSGAIAGAADVLLELERTGEDSDTRQRLLLGLSRYPQTPEALLIDHDAADGSWRVVGQADGRRGAGAIAWREKLLAALPNDEPGVTYPEIETLLSRGKKDWLKPLNDLVSDDQVKQSGEGRRGDPKRFRVSVPSFRSGPGTERTETAPISIPVSIPPVGRRIETESESGEPIRSVDDERNGNDGPTADERTLADLSDDELLDAFPGSALADDDGVYSERWTFDVEAAATPTPAPQHPRRRSSGRSAGAILAVRAR